jgi:hypothetical protein
VAVFAGIRICPTHAGSRVGLVLNGKAATFHRPHPQKEADKGAVIAMRKFSEIAEVDHDEA